MQLRGKLADLEMADGGQRCLAFSNSCQCSQFQQIAPVTVYRQRRQLALAFKVVEISVYPGRMGCGAHDDDLIQQARQCGAGSFAYVGQEIGRHVGSKAAGFGRAQYQQAESLRRIVQTQGQQGQRLYGGCVF